MIDIDVHLGIALVLGIVPEIAPCRFKHTGDWSIHIWNIPKLLLRHSDKVLQVGPFRNVALGEDNVLVAFGKALCFRCELEVSNQDLRALC